MTNLKTLLRLYLYKLFFKYSKFALSFSQEGEDKVLERIFENKKRGFYVDVGAHHPFRFSNTFKFYLQNWNGVNIDAMPGSMVTFNKYRPNDINIEAAVSDEVNKLTYYAFNESALNGFSDSISKDRNGTGIYKVIFTKEIITRRLETILDEHLKEDQSIDFLSIDVEGLDLNVLKSNNWAKYRPTIVLAEILNSENIYEDPVVQFMQSINYAFYAKTVCTVFFIDRLYGSV